MDKTYIARDEVWCEESGTRLLIEKDENEAVTLTIKCGHIEVKATLAQFRIERLVAVATAQKELAKEDFESNPGPMPPHTEP